MVSGSGDLSHHICILFVENSTVLRLGKSCYHCLKRKGSKGPHQALDSKIDLKL